MPAAFPGASSASPAGPSGVALSGLPPPYPSFNASARCCVVMPALTEAHSGGGKTCFGSRRKLLTDDFFFNTAVDQHGEALHALRARLKDPKNVLQSWDPTLVNPCTWFHVTCDDRNRVIRLDLGNSNISGPLGPELGRLENLQYLELYRNNFVGKIPEELGGLKSLISMDLYGNQLEGEIPKSFKNLRSLRFLRLSNNRLTGSIPRELASLSNLKVFDVSNNDLCGAIPIDGPFPTFPFQSYDNNSRLIGPELQGSVPIDFGC